MVLEFSDVALNWLPCFPYTAQKLVYDVFFIKGLTTEVVQTLVPSLSQRHGTGHDVNVALSNIERRVRLFLDSYYKIFQC